MKLAYLILAHVDLDQLVNLVNALQSEDAVFFIHIDKKIHINEDVFCCSLDYNENVYLIEERQPANWGGFSLTFITLSLLKTCLEAGDFDYISLLSGQDFPVKSPKYIADFLGNRRRENQIFLETHSLPYKNWAGEGGLDRVNFYWFMDDLTPEMNFRFLVRQKAENIKREMPLSLIPFGGSQWFTITNETAWYIIRFAESHPELIDYFRYTYVSDELLIPTILMNSPLSTKIANNNLRYIDWRSGIEQPKYLGMCDYALINESQCLFARKFNSKSERDLMNKIKSTWQ